MTGETDLGVLLEGLKPSLGSRAYVFCSVPGARYGDLAQLRPLASFQEPEGLTLVLTQEKADGEGLVYEGIFRCISLHVHSSLEAVGLTAAVATELAAHAISANVIAGFHHDHIFVPSRQADLAMARLRALELRARETRATLVGD